MACAMRWTSLDVLARHTGHEEVSKALRDALAPERPGRPPRPADVERHGGGWVAKEALGIAVFCALAFPDLDPGQVRQALLLAVNHSGDSDSTGAICGNLLGAWHGETVLPPAWVADIEGRGTILELADDLAAEYTHSGELHGVGGPTRPGPTTCQS